MKRFLLVSGGALNLGILLLLAGTVFSMPSWVLSLGLLTAAVSGGFLSIFVWRMIRKPDRTDSTQTENLLDEGNPEAVIQSLREEKDKLLSILEYVPSSFVVMDTERRILAASNNFHTVTGRSASEIVGKHCSMQLWSEKICMNCPAEVSLRSGRPEYETVRVETRDGKTRFFEHNSIPIRRDDRLFGVLETITDVTERIALHEEVVRAEKLSTAGEMSAVVAHEIRNSLTSVRMILQLLKEDVTLEKRNGSDAEQAIEVALKSLGQSESVIRHLLDFARPAPPHKVKTDVSKILDDCIDLVRRQYDRKRIDIRNGTGAILPRINVDPEQIRIAVVNLLLNACQAVEAGGMVTMEATVHQAGLPWERPVAGDDGVRKIEELDLGQGSEVLCIEVGDNGPGIPAESLDRIFDPFYTTKVNGTGLGLAMVKRVANEHGGLLTVRNLPRGCRFSMILPVQNTPLEV